MRRSVEKSSFSSRTGVLFSSFSVLLKCSVTWLPDCRWNPSKINTGVTFHLPKNVQPRTKIFNLATPVCVTLQRLFIPGPNPPSGKDSLPLKQILQSGVNLCNLATLVCLTQAKDCLPLEQILLSGVKLCNLATLVCSIDQRLFTPGPNRFDRCKSLQSGNTGLCYPTKIVHPRTKSFKLSCKAVQPGNTGLGLPR